MNASIDWKIPPSVLRWLRDAPTDRPVAALLRHSVRDHLSPGDAGYMLPITEVGTRLATELGRMIGRRLRSLHSSPLLRCVQTAEALRAGAAADLPILRDRLLGDPGVYVVDSRRASSTWELLGHEGVIRHLVAEDSALPGLVRPEPAARFLVQHMLTAAQGSPGMHMFVTHDSLVGTTAARLLGKPLGMDAWPWYLEAAFFWRNEDGVSTAYRDDHRHNSRSALCELSEVDVIEFARREVARTVGLNSGARFFLAGGAFKSLLTGRPPRDLDLWAPSAEDRKLLVSALEARGAKRLDDPRFAEAFEIAGSVVEVPHSVDASTLEERLRRSDIGLAAVGAEHCPGDRWTASIHPLAISSAECREIRLLKPLVNWRHALTTLERMRRYAVELGFVVPEAEEAEVWRIFERQPPEMKSGMLLRFNQNARGGFNVAEEAACRFR